MSPEKWRRIANAISPRRHWYETLTLPGRVYFCMMLFCGSAWVVDTPLLQLLTTLLCFAVVTIAVGVYFRPQLSMSVRTPAFAICDDMVDLHVTVRNVGSRTAWGLALELTSVPAGWEPGRAATEVGDLAPGQAACHRLTLKPIHRGRQRWPEVRCVTSFPFNLVRISRSQKLLGELLVAPRHRPLRCFALPNATNLTPGTFDQECPSFGEMQEYAGSREYQPGLAVRRWDYGAWARLGKPIARNFTDQLRPHAAICVDMSSTFARPTRIVREASLSLAASIGEALIHDHVPLGFVQVGRQSADTSTELPHRQQAVLLEALALAESCHEDKLEQLTRDIERHSIRAGVVYFIATTWDEHRAALQRKLERAGYRTRAIVVVEDVFSEQDLPPAGSDVMITPAYLIEAGGVELS